ncbi:MAG: cysteine-rich small domain-containing protein [Clostridia bacterium]|nr:cysteine-rich small domain-containing protein [Clostridia bacterium]
MKNSYKFFLNTDCKYFPCHKTADTECFNCLFCFCPLYALSDKCGGNFKFLPDGTKDCSECLLPHTEGGYEYIMHKFGEISELAGKKSDI